MIGHDFYWGKGAYLKQISLNKWPDLEEGVLVADGDELPVALSSLVSHAGQMGVSLLTVAADHLAVVKLILPEISISTFQPPFCNGYKSRVFHSELKKK